MTKRIIPLKPLGASPKQPERDKSRSSMYRDAAKAINADPMLRLYADMAKGLRGFRRKTLDWYCIAPIWGGTDPEIVRKFLQEGKKRNVAAIGSAANQEKAAARLARALALEAAGKKQKDIALELGMTTRGLRKLLKK
jgi:hypothetical protein